MGYDEKCSGDVKVLYADHWTLGLHNFLLYDDLLRKRGCERRLLHIGSYRAQPLASELKEGIECRDISHYKTLDLGRILDREKPDVVLTLNHFELFERALFKAARNRDIPCVYVMHGIRSESLEAYQQFYGSNTGMARRLKKIPKYMDLMRMYATAHLEADPLFLVKPHLYKIAWRFATSPIREIYQPETTDDTQPHLFLLYSNIDKLIYEQSYGMARARLSVVGNTKLDGLFKRAMNLTDQEHRRRIYDSLALDPSENYILNIEDAMVEMNSKSFPHDAQARWYKYMEAAVEKAGYRFIVKVHPGTNFNRFRTIFDGKSRTKVVQSADLDALIANSKAVVGTVSTALINAVALEKIVLACEWLDVEMLKSTNFVVKYGGAISCRTDDDFERCLADLDGCERQLSATRGEMLNLYVSHRDGYSCERVADAVVSIAHEYRDRRERRTVAC